MAAGQASVFWADSGPFSVPFTVSAHSQRLWIAPEQDILEFELQIKGTNWVCRAQPASACDPQATMLTLSSTTLV